MGVGEKLGVSNLTFECGLAVYIFKYSTFGIALGVSILHSKYCLRSTGPAWYGLGSTNSTWV